MQLPCDHIAVQVRLHRTTLFATQYAGIWTAFMITGLDWTYHAS